MKQFCTFIADEKQNPTKSAQPWNERTAKNPWTTGRRERERKMSKLANEFIYKTHARPHGIQSLETHAKNFGYKVKIVFIHVSISKMAINFIFCVNNIGVDPTICQELLLSLVVLFAVTFSVYVFFGNLSKVFINFNDNNL
jgi:hypothetical protein